ncbi:MAG: DUF4348 domain-containing protein [Bacteroidaceae bacterium]|nr:DUF4348 domain-containing protein [Bacteroidaceae bacterium]
MIRKVWVCLLLVLLMTASCKREQTVGETDWRDSTWCGDTLVSDSLSEVEEEMDEAVDENRVDGSFDDFIFTFTRLPHLQAQRTDIPLTFINAHGEVEDVTNLSSIGDFDFLNGDYYTVLYGSMRELEADHDETDTLVRVDKVDLNEQYIRTYTFEQLKGKWRLTRMSDRRFADDVLSDFYRFYAKFSSDSVFQAQSLAPMLNVSIHDTEDELSIIEGTIDASQWVSFCPEVPQNVISNIRYNQHYTNQRVVMQKCGMGTGLQEVFTFNNEGHGWRLTSYED